MTVVDDDDDDDDDDDEEEEEEEEDCAASYRPLERSVETRVCVEGVPGPDDV